MATTELEIWRLALTKIGNTNFPTSLTEQTAESLVCATDYPQVRDVTLELAAPSFAQKRFNLSQLTETRTGWFYTYAAPGDYVKLLGVVNELGKYLPLEFKEHYDVELSGDGNSKIILSNVEAVEMLYVCRPIISLWSPTFTDAVAYGLAVSLALGIKKDVAMAERMHEMYMLRIGQASASSEQQRNLGVEPEYSTIRSRA